MHVADTLGALPHQPLGPWNLSSSLGWHVRCASCSNFVCLFVLPEFPLRSVMAGAGPAWKRRDTHAHTCRGQKWRSMCPSFLGFRKTILRHLLRDSSGGSCGLEPQRLAYAGSAPGLSPRLFFHHLTSPSLSRLHGMSLVSGHRMCQLDWLVKRFWVRL